MVLWYLEAKFDYGYFINFFQYSHSILPKKIQVILTKIKGMTAVFAVANIREV